MAGTEGPYDLNSLLLLNQEMPMDIVLTNENIQEECESHIDFCVKHSFKVVEAEESWGKSLEKLPPFTIKEIEEQTFQW